MSLAFFDYLTLVVSNLLPTHYVTFIPFLCIYSAFLLVRISESRRIKKHAGRFLIISIALILIANVFFIQQKILPHLTSQTANAKMREFTISNIEDNALVIADSRIYRGRIAWLFNDKHYIEANYLSTLTGVNQENKNNLVQVTTYFVECAKDDCGWGTISEGELNQSMEGLVKEFKEKTKMIAEFSGGGGYNEETGEPHLIVYKGITNLVPEALSIADSTHNWFYYPVRYTPKEASWDYIKLEKPSEKLLYYWGFLILYLSIIIAILSPILMFYELKKSPKDF